MKNLKEAASQLLYKSGLVEKQSFGKVQSIMLSPTSWSHFKVDLGLFAGYQRKVATGKCFKR